MANDGVGDRLFEAGEDVEQAVVQGLTGAERTFRHYDPNQSLLLPPSLDDWLPQDHTARFIAEVVDECLELAEIYDSYSSPSGGAPPYDPRLMLKLLLYAYSTGVTSSRAMERRCGDDVAFRWLSANAAPDYRSIARFRRRHLVALDHLFIQVLELCAAAGLVSLGRVALDGTKLAASASKHKAMSHDRMGGRIADLEAQVRALLAEAEATDQAEDAEFGADRRGDELPKELAVRETRLAKLRAAKAAIEAQAKEKAAAQAAQKARHHGADEAGVHQAAEQAGALAQPNGRTQRNFTDPTARMMKTANGFEYSYNAQAVVDEGSQVVLAAAVVQAPTDVNQLITMIEAADTNLGRIGHDDTFDLVLADAGYWSEGNLAAAHDLGVDVLIATGRIDATDPAVSPVGRIPQTATAKQRMTRRLRTKAGRAHYARRKAIVEPVFGQMKVRQGAGQLRLRGLEGARGEWLLHVVCHNLRKLQKVTPADWTLA